MTVLEVIVQADDQSTFLRKGAIVTVTELTGERGRSRGRRAYIEKAIVDVGQGPFYSSHEDSYSFRLPRPGVYEVTVRHPGGVEIKQEELGRGGEADREVVVFVARGARRAGASQIPEYGGLPTVDGNRRSSFGDPTRQISIIPDQESYRLGPSSYGPPRTTGMSKQALGFEDLATHARLVAKKVVNGRLFAKEYPRISLAYEDHYSIYRNLQGDQITDDSSVPRWVSFHRHGYRDLVSIPWLWLPVYQEDNHRARINLIPGSRTPSKSRPLRIDVDDSRWGSLLAFVTAGKMNDAGVVADAILGTLPGSLHFNESLPQRALQGKLREPLVAALGGLVLVSNVEDTREKTWDQWLRNLANWFPGIPDGAAICGYRCLQQGREDEARRWLQKSVRGGLPFFSATFRLLSLGFAQLEDDESLRRISKGLAYVDPTQPFTVISLPS